MSLKGKEEGVKHRKTRKCKFIRQVYYLLNGYLFKWADMAGCTMAFSCILWLILSPLCPHHRLVPLWPQVVSFLCPYDFVNPETGSYYVARLGQNLELRLPQPLILG